MFDIIENCFETNFEICEKIEIVANLKFAKFRILDTKFEIVNPSN